jgi:hypothetical protein
MFNNYYINGNSGNAKCEVHLNAPTSGFIQKSNPVSRFIRFKIGSKLENSLFPLSPNEKPYLECKDYNGSIKYRNVTILQVCIFGDNQMLAEYVFDEDINQ